MVKSLVRVSPACMMAVVCAIHASSWGCDRAAVVEGQGPAMGEESKVVRGVTRRHIDAHST
eukprot:9164824-Heterocapsa_arctica.AAC.1